MLVEKKSNRYIEIDPRWKRVSQKFPTLFGLVEEYILLPRIIIGIHVDSDSLDRSLRQTDLKAQLLFYI